MDAEYIEIIDRADNIFKLVIINKLKTQLNTQHDAAYKQINIKDMYKCKLNTVIIARQ